MRVGVRVFQMSFPIAAIFFYENLLKLAQRGWIWVVWLLSYAIFGGGSIKKLGNGVGGGFNRQRSTIPTKNCWKTNLTPIVLLFSTISLIYLSSNSPFISLSNYFDLFHVSMILPIFTLFPLLFFTSVYRYMSIWVWVGSVFSRYPLSFYDIVLLMYVCVTISISLCVRVCKCVGGRKI